MWLDVRVDAKPPIALEAQAFAKSRQVFYSPHSRDTRLVDYMRDGKAMVVRNDARRVAARVRLDGQGRSARSARVYANIHLLLLC